MYRGYREKSEDYRRYLSLVTHGLGLVRAIRFREIRTSSVDYDVKAGGKVHKRPRTKVMVIPQFRVGSTFISPSQLSEGTLRTLLLVYAMLETSSTALFIEEPEVCVHHGLLSSMTELLVQQSRLKQVFMSTHSESVLDHVKPENVLTVSNRPRFGTRVVPISKALSAVDYRGLRKYLATEGNLGEYIRESGLGRIH